MSNLGTDETGSPWTSAYAVNSSGQVVGSSSKYDSAGVSLGWRPVRWDSSGRLTELDMNGFASGSVYAIDSSGQAAGTGTKYAGAVSLGTRPMRWDSAGAATELAMPWTTAGGSGECSVRGMNDYGQVCGTASITPGDRSSVRAVRWEANGTATVLGSPGGAHAGYSTTVAGRINSSGQTTGYAMKYVSGVQRGTLPVRWDASGAITELETLGTSYTGDTGGEGYAINDSGQVAGSVDKYVSGSFKGSRPVRWDSTGAAMELDLLGTTSSGFTAGEAYDINAAGFTVGAVDRYDDLGGRLGSRAVYWRLDGSVVDLNTLIDPLSGWILTEADSISENGWISGLGSFDPDGTGPTAAYSRLFVMQVPEPSGVMLLAIGGLGLLGRRRTGRRPG
jgi:hypothetical protein